MLGPRVYADMSIIVLNVDGIQRIAVLCEVPWMPKLWRRSRFELEVGSISRPMWALTLWSASGVRGCWTQDDVKAFCGG